MPGRAAAQLGLGDLAQLEPGDRLAAARGAGRGRPGRARGGRRRGRRRSPPAGAAARPGRARRASRRRRAPARRRRGARSAYAGSSASSSAYSFIVEPQPAALTTTYSTPVASKVSTSAPGEALRLRLAAVVHRQRAAAALRARDDDVAALGLQHPRGGGVDAGEERALHAAGEHARRPPGARPAAGCARAAAPACRAAAPGSPSRRAGATAARAGRCGAARGRGRCAGRRAAGRAPAAAAAGAGTARRSARAAPCRLADRSWRRSTWARVCSMSRSYCTPDGQAVTHAMQPRQASQC